MKTSTTQRTPMGEGLFLFYFDLHCGVVTRAVRKSAPRVTARLRSASLEPDTDMFLDATESGIEREVTVFQMML